MNTLDDFDGLAAERTYERALLAAVVAWAREQGWERSLAPRCLRAPDGLAEVSWTARGLLMVSLRTRRTDWWDRSLSFQTASVREGIDLLAALRIVPAHFSTVYAAGRASARVEQWGRVMGWC